VVHARRTDYLRLAERNSRMAGFTVTHYLDRFQEARAQLGGWLASGELQLREHVEEGIEAGVFEVRIGEPGQRDKPPRDCCRRETS